MLWSLQAYSEAYTKECCGGNHDKACYLAAQRDMYNKLYMENAEKSAHYESWMEDTGEHISSIYDMMAYEEEQAKKASA
jgi:hypothetical protein